MFNGSDSAPTGVIAQNTDPFVFGERFLYTFCRQPGNARLRRLARGSVILFGSQSGGEFVLDTVFVVADSVDHTRDDYLEAAAVRTNAVFRATTLDPMYGWDATVGGRLYFGATHAEQVGRMFSFVPCRPTDPPTAFARPPVTLPGLVKPRLAMQARTVPLPGLARAAEIWRAVVDQVLGSELALGLRVETPGPRTGTEWS